MDFQNDSIMPKTRLGNEYSFEEADASAQLSANQLYMKLLDEMGIATSNKAGKDRPYPDYFGGAYTDETCKLYVLVKGNQEKGRETIEKMIKGGDMVEYLPCEHSYQELTDVINHITNVMTSLNEAIRKNISMYYLDVIENSVVVGLNICTKETIAEFKKHVADHKAIVFIEGLKAVECNTIQPPNSIVNVNILSPGSLLSISEENDDSYGSWAFRAHDVTDTTKIGMVTAAHVMVTPVAYVHGFYVGTCTKQVHAGSVDAAFVELEEPLSPFEVLGSTNGFYNEYIGGRLIGSQYVGPLDVDIYTPVVGTTINMRGWTTGHSSGVVVSTNYNVILSETTTLTNLTAASYNCNLGDSGGIVYTYFSSLGKRYTTGIVKGRVDLEPSNHFVCSYFTKADVALDSLGVERY